VMKYLCTTPSVVAPAEYDYAKLISPCTYNDRSTGGLFVRQPSGLSVPTTTMKSHSSFSSTIEEAFFFDVEDVTVSFCLFALCATVPGQICIVLRSTSMHSTNKLQGKQRVVVVYFKNVVVFFLWVLLHRCKG
jgi:hypothetical protein